MRRIPLSYRSHVTGFQAVVSGSAQHESALERDYVTLVRFIDPVAQVTSQPVTLRFHDGVRWRRYTPDFLVCWSNGRTGLVEVKYRADLREHWKQLRPGFIAARTWGCEHSARFRIATDRYIRRPVLQNAKRLLPLRLAPLDPQVANDVVRVIRSGGPLSFGTLAAQISGERSVVLGTIWRMLARNALLTDMSTTIGFQSSVSLP